MSRNVAKKSRHSNYVSAEKKMSAVEEVKECFKSKSAKTEVEFSLEP